MSSCKSTQPTIEFGISAFVVWFHIADIHLTALADIEFRIGLLNINHKYIWSDWHLKVRINIRQSFQKTSGKFQNDSNIHPRNRPVESVYYIIYNK